MFTNKGAGLGVVPNTGVGLGVAVAKDLIRDQIKPDDTWEDYMVACIMKERGTKLCRCGATHQVSFETMEYFIVLATNAPGPVMVTISPEVQADFFATIKEKLGIEPPFKLVNFEDSRIIVE